jgi:hypothetical protein
VTNHGGEGGGGGVFATDVTDGEPAEVVEQEGVVEVSAGLAAGGRGTVGGGELEAGDVGERVREQAALEGVGYVRETLALLAP